MLLAYVRHIRSNVFFGKLAVKAPNILSKVTNLEFEH